MHKTLIAGLKVASLIVAFAAGLATAIWWGHRDLKQNPCSVPTWSPAFGYGRQTQSPRDCLALSEHQTFKGDWADFVSGGGFVPVGSTSDIVYDIEADGIAKAQLQWLAGVKTIPELFSQRHYQVEFIGRIGRREGIWIHARPDVIVVDRIISARIQPSTS